MTKQYKDIQNLSCIKTNKTTTVKKCKTCIWLKGYIYVMIFLCFTNSNENIPILGFIAKSVKGESENSANKGNDDTYSKHRYVHCIRENVVPPQAILPLKLFKQKLHGLIHFNS